jgi:Lar family restriction alleviation protein
MIDELLPCPFCGSKELTPLHDDWVVGQEFAIRCVGCGCLGPRALTRPEAMKRWNRPSDELAKLREEVAGYERLIQLQRKRMGEATKLWRQATGEHEGVWPDLGDLLEWLIKRCP